MLPASETARVAAGVAAPFEGGASHRTQIVELQSVRGVAALVVLWSHCLKAYDRPGRLVHFVQLINNDEAAVFIFFVLSGYVLALSLRTDLSWRRIGDFYIKRLFRIYPAIWSASLLGLAYVLIWHGIAAPSVSPWFLDRYRADRYNTIFVLLSFLGVVSYLLPPLWSVAVELVGSALMPLIAFVRQRDGKLFAVTTAGIWLAGVTFGAYMPYHLGIYIAYFCFGAMVLDPQFRFLARGWLCATALGYLIVVRLLPIGWQLAYTSEALCGAVLVGGIVHGVRPRWLRSRPILWLGHISYSVYLMHFPLMAFAIHLLPPSPIVLALVTMAATFPLAVLNYRFVELPGIAWGRVQLRQPSWR